MCGRYKHRPTDQRHLTVIVIRSVIKEGNSQYCNIRTLFQRQIRTLLQPIKIFFSQSEYFFFSKSEYFYSQSKHSESLQLSILLGWLLNAQFHLKQLSEGMKGGVKEIKTCENLHSGQSRSDPCDCVGVWVGDSLQLMEDGSVTWLMSCHHLTGCWCMRISNTTLQKEFTPNKILHDRYIKKSEKNVKMKQRGKEWHWTVNINF